MRLPNSCKCLPAATGPPLWLEMRVPHARVWASCARRRLQSPMTQHVALQIAPILLMQHGRAGVYPCGPLMYRAHHIFWPRSCAVPALCWGNLTSKRKFRVFCQTWRPESCWWSLWQFSAFAHAVLYVPYNRHTLLSQALGNGVHAPTRFARGRPLGTRAAAHMHARSQTTSAGSQTTSAGNNSSAHAKVWACLHSTELRCLK